MLNIKTAYIDGKFVAVQGSEVVESINPTTEQTICTATLANRADAKLAIAVAQRTQQSFGRTSKSERIDMLRRLQAAVLARTDHIREVTIDEYGGPVARAQWVAQYASDCFENSAQALRNYEMSRQIGSAQVVMQPVGVAGLIAPWNSTAGSICSKLASAIAAGCTSVIKPSELSPLQAQVVAEALHDAQLPPGVFNILLGRGDDVGDEISTNPAIRKISFTGSTTTGQIIARSAADTMKRVSLALTGKSASILLEDADLPAAIPLALAAAFMNNGQACVAGTRLLVPRAQLNKVIELVQLTVANMKVGDPHNPDTTIGPLASRAQYERIQHYIRRGLEQGAKLLAGGTGKPPGLERGYFVQPTVFAHVRPEMDISREEIFGPVLSILAYDDEDDAIQIANDSPYGLYAYIFSRQTERARKMAERLETGAVLINRIGPELLAPFGGVKLSGIGREFGSFGMESFLEPKTIVGA